MKIKFSISKLEKLVEKNKEFVKEDYYTLLTNSLKTHRKLDKLILSTEIAGDQQAQMINSKAKRAIKASRVEILRILSLFNTALIKKSDSNTSETEVPSDSNEEKKETSNEFTSENAAEKQVDSSKSEDSSTEFTDAKK